MSEEPDRRATVLGGFSVEETAGHRGFPSQPSAGERLAETWLTAK
jgi:hypothetical protein